MNAKQILIEKLNVPFHSHPRYYACFLKKNLEMLDGKLRQYVQWCLDNCKYTKVSPRQYPPSSVEVAVRTTRFSHFFSLRSKIHNSFSSYNIHNILYIDLKLKP